MAALRRVTVRGRRHRIEKGVCAANSSNCADIRLLHYLPGTTFGINLSSATVTFVCIFYG